MKGFESGKVWHENHFKVLHKKYNNAKKMFNILTILFYGFLDMKYIVRRSESNRRISRITYFSISRRCNEGSRHSALQKAFQIEAVESSFIDREELVI